MAALFVAPMGSMGGSVGLLPCVVPATQIIYKDELKHIFANLQQGQPKGARPEVVTAKAVADSYNPLLLSGSEGDLARSMAAHIMHQLTQPAALGCRARATQPVTCAHTHTHTCCDSHNASAVTHGQKGNKMQTRHGMGHKAQPTHQVPHTTVSWLPLQHLKQTPWVAETRLDISRVSATHCICYRHHNTRQPAVMCVCTLRGGWRLSQGDPASTNHPPLLITQVSTDAPGALWGRTRGRPIAVI